MSVQIDENYEYLLELLTTTKLFIKAYENLKNKNIDPIDMINKKIDQIKSKREYGVGSCNKGKRWTKEEYNMVRELFDNNKSVGEISVQLGRSRTSIEVVLARLDLIKVIYDENGELVQVKNNDPKPEICAGWTIKNVENLVNIFNEEENMDEVVMKLNKKCWKWPDYNIEQVEDKLIELGLIELVEN